jgi:hypothetical protein
VSEGPEWFAPKRYGYGSGVPIRWQGWAVIIAFVAIAILVSLALRDRPLVLVATIIPVATILLVICARTTRGGWRWRWGEED